MIDWIVLLDNLLYWVQWLTTFTILGLIGIACLAFFISRKMAIDCALIAIVLFIIATVLGQLGIQLLAPELLSFLHSIFK